jgi:DNA topoisomerase-3
MKIQNILLKQIMKVLNVAEKNDAAKSLALIMSNGTSRMRQSYSPYNKIYEFNLQLFNRQNTMLMTSVSGHLLSLEFIQQYKGWTSCSPEELFSAQVAKGCPENYELIKKSLEKEVRDCDKLIIWTDCDREGENIGILIKYYYFLKFYF